MFAQVIRSRVDDAAEVRRLLDRWRDELAAGAEGWLGCTAGVTDAGEFVAVVRFADEAAARRNSERPEQGSWWAETEKAFSGSVAFHDCAEVLEAARGGGSDDAGFVQVMQGRTDGARMAELDREWERVAPDFRPDLLGTTTALHGDGGFTAVAYFTSEAEAREGERSDMPPEAAAAGEEMGRLMQDVEFLDLRDPWLYSPA